MSDETNSWILALESSTPNGGAALLRDDGPAETIRLTEGLRHGRELVPAAAALLRKAGLSARDLWGVAVSAGPGSYTGVRVGVMAAKALAYGAGCRLAAVSSLAALAESLRLEGAAGTGDLVACLQDARRDEVYCGLYRLEESAAVPLAPDAALAPEEARTRLAHLFEQDRPGSMRLAGSGFATYPDLFRDLGGDAARSGVVNPEAVARLGRRQFLREEFADPLSLQPEYPRRDPDADWTRDALINMA